MAEKKAVSEEQQAKTKVITSKVRMSYCHVWEPVAMQDGKGDKKYSVSLIIPKSDKELVDRINAAINEAKEQGKEKWGGKIPLNLKVPLRDGDAERGDDPNYKDAWFLSASTKTKPGIVDADRQPIIDESEFYSGCYGRASINFYAFNVNGSKGIACGLNHLQKLADGEALGGRGKAEDDFDDDLIS